MFDVLIYVRLCIFDEFLMTFFGFDSCWICFNQFLGGFGPLLAIYLSLRFSLAACASRCPEEVDPKKL